MNGSCNCGHPWDYHGPEVPGCVECRCRRIRPSLREVVQERQKPTQEPPIAQPGTPAPCGCVQALRDEANRALTESYAIALDAGADFLESRATEPPRQPQEPRRVPR